MKTSTNNALWGFIAGSREGVLATVGPTGTPQLSNVYYIVSSDDRIVRVSTTAVRAKGRNLALRPRAALHVAGPDFFNFAVAEGDVTVIEATVRGDPATDELYEVHTVLNGKRPRRPEFDDRMITDRRLVARLAVTKLYGLVHPSR